MRGKLELTWVGKDERPRLEPRVLVEDPSKSYGDPGSENMLIFGDNLLALKALEQDFAGRIKCIFIDPPYNTGAAWEHLAGDPALLTPRQRAEKTGTYVWLVEHDYVVILHRRELGTGTVFFLRSAYHVDGPWSRKNFERKYADRIR